MTHKTTTPTSRTRPQPNWPNKNPTNTRWSHPKYYLLHTRTYVPNLHHDPSIPSSLSTQHPTPPTNNIPPNNPSCTVIPNPRKHNWPKHPTKSKLNLQILCKVSGWIYTLSSHLTHIILSYPCATSLLAAHQLNIPSNPIHLLTNKSGVYSVHTYLDRRVSPKMGHLILYRDWLLHLPSPAGAGAGAELGIAFGVDICFFFIGHCLFQVMEMVWLVHTVRGSTWVDWRYGGKVRILRRAC